MIFSVSAMAQVDRSTLPEPGEARPVEIGDYETFTLKNGLQVFVIENHKLPRVSYRLKLDRKPLEENEKAGYLGMVGELMSRGTTTRTKEQIDEEVDFIGASLSVGSQSAYASGLSKYNETVLELMADVILNPTFPDEELEKIRKRTLSGIQAGKDDPDAISSNLVSKVVYGEDHPYGEVATEETVKNIKIDDLKEYHQTYFKPNIAYLAVVGDVDLKETKKLVKKYFESWKSGEIPDVNYEKPTPPATNKVALVNRPNSVQSVVKVTYPVELLPTDADVIPVEVMNQILGGGFSARLNMNLREEKGYTYGSRSSLSEDELISRFSAGASVRNEVTDSTVIEIFREMKGIRNEPVTDKEMELAQNSIAGSFARSLESPQTVASFAINTAIYDLPEDYYSTYIQKVQDVTKEDVKKMAEKYILPVRAYITVVGKGSEVEEGLKKFGEISYYDTYGNPIDPAAMKLPEGLTAEKIFDDYFEAVGGKQKLAAVNSLKIVMSADAMGNKLTMTKANKVPEKLSINIEMGGNVVSKQVYDGTNAKVTQMGQPVPVDEKMKAQLAMEAYPFPELHFDKLGIETSLVGIEEVDGKEAYAVEVKNPDGKTYTLYFDKASNLLIRKSQVAEMPNGQTMVQNTELGDYQEVEGILFPHNIKLPLGPGFQADANVETIEVNKEIPEETFKTN